MKASIKVANGQPTSNAAGLAVGQALQLPTTKDVILRVSTSIWLVISASGTVTAATSASSLDTAAGIVLAPSSTVEIIL